jgi:hypothetical protein
MRRGRRFLSPEDRSCSIDLYRARYRDDVNKIIIVVKTCSGLVCWRSERTQNY